MPPSLTNHLEDIDCEFQPDKVLRARQESTTQYAGALLHLASLQTVRNSRTYCQAFHVLEQRAEQYHRAQGMEQLVMRN